MNFLITFVILMCITHSYSVNKDSKTSPQKNDSYKTGNNTLNIKDINVTSGTSHINALARIFRKKIEQLKVHKEIELVILVDGSRSIGPKNFKSEIKYIQKVISDVEVGPSAFRLGIIVYSAVAVIYEDHLSVVDPTDLEKCSLLHFRIPKIIYPGKGTNTKQALEQAEKILTRSRKGAMKVIFLITDGFSNLGNPIPMADILKSQGVIIYTFGIVNGNAKELLAIATKPVAEHVYLFDAFDDFEGFARRALHEDLSAGFYAPVKNPQSCNYLCKNSTNNGCCSNDTTCSCGLISGHFACLCPPGFYGSGLVGEGCTPCPEGTYSEGLFPGDILTCIPCPDIHHTTNKFPATSKANCVCSIGTIPDGEKCKIGSCPPLDPPANGYFVKKNCSNVVNAACGVRCHMGHVLTGSSVRICQKNGTWSGVQPICQPKSCEKPKSVPGSKVACSDDENFFSMLKEYNKFENEVNPAIKNYVKNKITFSLDSDENSTYPVGTKCSYSCLPGHSIAGSKTRDCLPMLKWSGLKPTCKKILCPSLPELVSGTIKPKNCTTKGIKHSFGELCKFFCNSGYELKGPKHTNCTGNHGSWSEKNTPSRCVDVEPPQIDCPKNISVKTDEGVHFAKVTLTLPNTTDNSGKQPIIWSKPPFEKNSTLRFIIGENEIQIYSVDEAGNYGFCSFNVEVKDEEKPSVLECQSPPIFFISEFSTADTKISWKEPIFDDNSGIPVSILREPAINNFFKGITTITYTGTDVSGNNASCAINITILENPCSERPTDSNSLWNCSTNKNKLTTCVVSCPEGYTFFTNTIDDTLTLNCTYNGRKAFWSPNILQDYTLYPECSEIDTSGDTKTEIEIEISDSFCNDLNSLSNVIINSVASEDDNLSVIASCDEDDWSDVSEEDENESDISKNLVNSEVDRIHEKGKNRLENITEASKFKKEESENKQNENVISAGKSKETKSSKRVKKDVQSINNLENLNYNKPLLTQNTSAGHSNLRKKVKANNFNPKNNLAKRGRRRKKLRISLKDINKSKTNKNEDLSSTIEAIRQFYKKQGNSDLEIGPPKIKTTMICKNGSLAKNNYCVKCPKGTFHNVSAAKCDSCPRGQYQETEGQVKCVECPEGYWTRRMRRRNVKQCLRICPPGTYGNNSFGAEFALAPCTSCPKGFYQSLRGQAKCENCPENLTTIRRGATSLDHCVNSSEFDNVCSKINCRNGGTCIVNDGFPLCMCLPGFLGSFCENIFDPCGSFPCYNGGQCYVNNSIEYTCNCSAGYEGDQCEKEINECSSNPCSGHGECTDLVNDYKCDCFSGFKGVNCNESISYCEELQPCLNNGTCVEKNGTYSCICPSGFFGLHCDITYDCQSEDCSEEPIKSEVFNPCTNYTCPQNSMCILNRKKQPSCICTLGFRGKDCAEEVNSNVILTFPKHGVTEYLFSDFPERDIDEISVCVWIKTKDTFNYGTLFSYATFNEDNSFTLTDYSGVVLYVSGKYVVTDLQANDGYWHYICVTWQSNGGHWEVYLDGILFSNGTGLSNNTLIPGGGRMIIGQEQDTFGGGFNDVESFAGQITNFDVWSRVLKSYEIRTLYESCDIVYGNLITWMQFLQNINGEITEKHSMFCKTCDSNLKVYHGKIYYDIVDNEKVAKYICDEGYVIKFNSKNNIENEQSESYIRKCMKYGEWHTKEPKCRRISCGFPGYFLRGKILGKSYLYGDKIIYRCSENYVIEGNDTRVCLSSGSWSGKAPYCRGTSTECEKLIAPRHGSMFVYLNNIKPYSTSVLVIGDRVEFTCDKGYTLKGFGMLTCIEGGIWDREPAICEKIKCRHPTEISMFLPAIINNTSTFSFGDVISITCPSGKRQSIICEELGRWNITGDICSNQCKEKPPNVLNGYFVGDKSRSFFFEGETLQVQCATGYYLVGDDNFKCATNGTWIQARNSVCRRVTCGPPPRPPQAYEIAYEEGYDYGNRIFLRCTPGYTSPGEIFMRCEANGRYSRVSNRCTRQ